MTNTYQSLKKYKYVKEYNQSVDIPKSTVERILKDAWEVTPSKSNFMPYKIHVLGPEHQELKNLVYKKCIKNESRVDDIPDPELVRYQDHKPRYWNIVSCSYLLIFTERVEKNPNLFQQHCIKKGYVFEQMDAKNLIPLRNIARLEIGMFSATVSAMCLEKDIDVSHTVCFAQDLESWSEEEFNFVDAKPIMLMTLGQGNFYRQDIPLEPPSTWLSIDPKPDFETIVNII